mmetsp:Transcript_19821/g.36434  ORF Transcript_19821/g.36434 Transcript_19821/m.36434 type:complete len:123 (-) Transcript_19821:55-423(-)
MPIEYESSSHHQAYNPHPNPSSHTHGGATQYYTTATPAPFDSWAAQHSLQVQAAAPTLPHKVVLVAIPMESLSLGIMAVGPSSHDSSLKIMDMAAISIIVYQHSYITKGGCLLLRGVEVTEG